MKISVDLSALVWLNRKNQTRCQGNSFDSSGTAKLVPISLEIFNLIRLFGITQCLFISQVTAYLLDQSRLIDDDTTYKLSLDIEPREARPQGGSRHSTHRMSISAATGASTV